MNALAVQTRHTRGGGGGGGGGVVRDRATSMPNVHTYNTALRACAAAGEIEAMERVLALMDRGGTPTIVHPNEATREIVQAAYHRRRGGSRGQLG